MSTRLDVTAYLTGPEDLRRRELVWGVVHEPPAPRFGHQAVVTRTTVILDQHVRPRQLGVVCVSPVDVVLDPAKALVVQPDVLFVSTARAAIVRDQVWGAPDLVVEVASRHTAVRDRTTKIRWYRDYGVRECWLLDLTRKAITIVDLQPGAGQRVFAGEEPVQSVVLPELAIEAQEFFT